MSRADRKDNQIDRAWELIEERYQLLNTIDKGEIALLTASQIRDLRDDPKCGNINFEARLLSKFDNSAQLPRFFKENDLGILPLERGSYGIGRFACFENLHLPEQPPKLTEMSISSQFESLNSFLDDRIKSEALALNAALCSGIIPHFLNEEELALTISGRHSSGRFDFDIASNKGHSLQHLSVVNAQIEIDGGYENRESLTIFEAKASMPENFMIRQLFYPYRAWQNHVTKPIRNVFLVYSDSIFHLFEYDFEDARVYNSLRCIRYERYSLAPVTTSKKSLVELYRASAVEPEPHNAQGGLIPFPQADSIERVFDLCNCLADTELSKDDIQELYGFHDRQVDYYSNACCYLGFVQPSAYKTRSFALTELGRQFVSSSYSDSCLLVCRQLFKRQAFHDAFGSYLRSDVLPAKEELVRIIEAARPDLTRDTPQRRASTVRHWLGWIISTFP